MTGEVVSLRAHDGHVLSAYQARPDKPPRGGLVLLQEIFGVTAHIRRVCDGYAAQGYHVVAPALFDRVRPGIELGYSKQDAATGRDLRSRVPWDHVFADVIAAKAQLSGSGKIAALGYCWGGTIAWRSAVHVDGVAAAVCYYATQIRQAGLAATIPENPVDYAQPLGYAMKSGWGSRRLRTGNGKGVK